ncbi:MAG: cytochrome P450 [Ferruginibacter sp.]
MTKTVNKYNFPPGYSFLHTLLRSKAYLKDPIGVLSGNLEKFSGSYTSALSTSAKIIVTQDPDFISYILRDNHKNYHKSQFAEGVSKFYGKGILYSNGEYWLRQRRLIQPGFHKEKIHGLYEIIITSIRDALSNFPVGERIDIYPTVHNLSFNVLIKSLFDINLSPSIIAEIKQLFIETQDFLFTDMNQPWRRLFYPFTGIRNDNLKKASRLKEIIGGIILERRASTGSYADFLDMLLNSRYEDTGEAMNDAQITDELLVFVLAGHETTGNALSWLLYLVASNHEVLQKLMNSFHDSSIYDSVSNEYVKAIINEGMRLYPAAWLTDRVALEDDQFNNFSYPKGTIIIPFFFGLHRDKNFWEDASAFKPERFLGESKLAKSKYFVPFGAGPRMCIGNNFAMAEMSFFLYEFLHEFKIEATGQVPVIKPLITLRPDEVLLNIRRINR